MIKHRLLANKFLILGVCCVLGSTVFLSCNSRKNVRTIIETCSDLKPLTVKKHKTLSGEWRDTYTEIQEPLQSYISRNPPRATPLQSKLYILKIGNFDKKGNEILELTKEYLAAFYQIKVEAIRPLSIDKIPHEYTREKDYGLQINSKYLIDSVLPGLLPHDGFALLAFSSYDLFPDTYWNFVFGEASLQKRVGVWSLARFGGYNESDSSFKLSLRRTLNTAVHETGHMFGITHCVQNECCMNGSISLAESDKQSSWFCWECLAKVCWNRSIYPQQHLKAVLEFYKKNLNDKTCIEHYTKALKLIK